MSNFHNFFHQSVDRLMVVAAHDYLKGEPRFQEIMFVVEWEHCFTVVNSFSRLKNLL